MRFKKFVQMYSKIKESLPKAFDEAVEFHTPVSPIIPLSAIKSKLISCSFKAEEPNEFPIIVDGKIKKKEIDCFDAYVTIYVPESHELKSLSPITLDDDASTEDIQYDEYQAIESKEDDIGGRYHTIFFGDFLKMLLNETYSYCGVDKSFYDRLGVIPVIIDKKSGIEEPQLYHMNDSVMGHIYYPVTDDNGNTLAYIYMKI